jgi:predicted MFS family arabinose efflux permease
MGGAMSQAEHSAGPSSALIVVIAIAAGALVANLYYAQPLVGEIADAIGMSRDVAGAIVSVTQIGYGMGLFFLVSLADLVESKRLTLMMLGITIVALIGAAMAPSAAPLLACFFLIGLCSTAAQVLVPLLAHLVPVEQRGRVVGNVMGGLLTGIMLARPLSLFVATAFGWRAIFWASSVLMLAIGIGLVLLMPRHRPTSGLHYGHILASMGRIFATMPVLRWRALYQALLFAAFNLFWTAAPLMLTERFHLTGNQIGLFALAGAGGALAAPVAGRMADRGLGRLASMGAMATLGFGFLLTGWAVAALALPALVIVTVAIDAAVQMNQVATQRILFSGPSETRGRVNALYMTTCFVGGAIGSVLGTVSYHRGGWNATMAIGAVLGLGALFFFVTLGRRAER